MAKICLIFLEQDNITRNRFANYSKSTCSPINIRGITVYFILRCSTLICCLAKTF